jgi:hypothetical protein
MDIIRKAAPRCLRFMTLCKEKVSNDLIHLLKLILTPGRYVAVMLAIKLQDSSKLPARFKTSCRILTNSDQMESKAENGSVNLDLTHTDSSLTEKSVPAAASQLPALESSNLSDSTVYPLVDNNIGEVCCYNLKRCGKNLIFNLSKQMIETRPKFPLNCSGPLGESLSKAKTLKLRNFRTHAMLNFVRLVISFLL